MNFKNLKNSDFSEKILIVLSILRDFLQLTHEISVIFHNFLRLEKFIILSASIYYQSNKFCDKKCALTQSTEFRNDGLTGTWHALKLTFVFRNTWNHRNCYKYPVSTGGLRYSWAPWRGLSLMDLFYFTDVIFFFFILCFVITSSHYHLETTNKPRNVSKRMSESFMASALHCEFAEKPTWLSKFQILYCFSDNSIEILELKHQAALRWRCPKCAEVIEVCHS